MPTMVLEDRILLNSPVAKPGVFAMIEMSAEQDPEKLPHDWNLHAIVGLHSYAGMCDVQLTKISDDPYEAEYSTSDCDVFSIGNIAKARIDSARFHVKNCYVEDP